MSRADERADAALTAASAPSRRGATRARARGAAGHARRREPGGPGAAPRGGRPRAARGGRRVARTARPTSARWSCSSSSAPSSPGDPWSGQIAFPGGRHEPQDASLLDTATRETREELGLDLSLDARAARHARRPVSAHARAAAHRRAAVRLRRRARRRRSRRATRWRSRSGSRSPCFAAPGASVTSTVRPRGADMLVPSVVHDGHTIWGMTQRMLRQLLARFAQAV